MGPSRSLCPPLLCFNRSWRVNAYWQVSNPVGSAMATSGFVFGPFVIVGGQDPTTTHGIESPGKTICEEVLSRCEHNQASCLKVIQGFS